MTSRSTRSLTAIAVLAVALSLIAAAPAAAAPGDRGKPPIITWVRCWPERKCQDRTTIEPGGVLRIAGNRFLDGMRVTFAGSPGRGDDVTVTAQVINRRRAVATVPDGASSGPVVVNVRGRGRSAPSVVLSVAGGTGGGEPAPDPNPEPDGDRTAFDGEGMWIWIVSRAAGGNAARIAAQAREHGIETVYIKSADGTATFSQFNTDFVRELKRQGLKVCAWHYVYGNAPVTEAIRTADAKRRGADCVVIDAEVEYYGKYRQAAAYIAELRRRVGDDYPVGFTSFPYVHYHPRMPYSVFLGPGGAQYNLPQMYWHAIGGSVESNFETTYTHNRVYGRRIYPLGQAYEGPPAREILRFRRLAVQYGATGVSWWSWQHATGSDWRAIGARLGKVPRRTPSYGWPALARGSRGDLVVWAQMHLNGAGQRVEISGSYNRQTQSAVRAFQAGAGLPVTGRIDDATWPRLLEVEPARVSWRR